MEFMEYKIDKELIVGWLRVLARKSGGEKNLRDAITLAYFSDLTEEEQSIIHTLHNLYLAELSGKIIPPIYLEELYLRLVSDESF